MSRTWEDCFGYSFEHGNETLFYPLGLRYFSRSLRKNTDNCSSYVRLYGLTPDTIRAEHLRRHHSDSTRDNRRVVMRHVCVRIPITFNLYLIIPQENETSNVEQTQRIITRFIENRLLFQMNRRSHNRDYVYGYRFDNGTAKKKKKNNNIGKNDRDEMTGNSDRLDRVIENLNLSIRSLYDLVDVVSKRMHFEQDGVNDYDKVRFIDNTVLCNMYVWRFDDEHMYRAILEHMSENASMWHNVYNVPTSLDDEVLRFSLDMLLEQKTRNERIHQERFHSKLTTMIGGSKTMDTLSDLIVNSLDANHHKRPQSVNVETMLQEYEREQQFGQQRQQFDECIDKSDDTSIDLYLAFAMGEWCLVKHANDYNGNHYNNMNNNSKRNNNIDQNSNSFSSLIVRIDRTAFKRICDSMIDLKRALSDETNENDDDSSWMNLLYDTPLVFLPTMVWDIETIARKPGTIPRGVSQDEALVSIALTIERSSLDSRCYALVMVLVPDETEHETISKFRLLSDESRPKSDVEIRDPVIVCYRDERAMLLDFYTLMSRQTPLLYSFLNVKQSYLQDYVNVASFLVGHNTVGYDYAFLHNRCSFYGMAYVTKHLSRNIHNKLNDVLCMYTFNDAQLCIDTLLFLMTRVRSLPAFDLASVLNIYQCDISKGSLDARAIRYFYNALGNEREMKRLGYETTDKRFAYFKSFLVYNLYDCLSLASLLRKLSFPVFADTIVKYFRVSMNTACYCGNSRLLPSLFVSNMLLHKREILPLRPKRNLSLFAVDEHSQRIDELFGEIRRTLNRLNNVRVDRPVLRYELNVHAYTGFDHDYTNEYDTTNNDDWLWYDDDDNNDNANGNSNSSVNVNDIDENETTTQESNARKRRVDRNFEQRKRYCRSNQRTNRRGVSELFKQTVIPYARRLDVTINVSNENDNNNNNNNNSENNTVHRTNIRWVDPTTIRDLSVIQYSSHSSLCDAELDLLRVGEKTYIGGLNYADPCHVKNPILMDYNSFYPSIIRHYELDMNNVAVFTVLKLLTLIRPLQKLNALLATRALRIFDYTPEHSLHDYVNVAVFEDERFDDVFRPVRYAKRKWYEGIEMDNAELLIASTRLFTRRVLIVWRKTTGSTVARIVTDALVRRAEWKKKRKITPDDKVLESRELMEKLLANGTYGYLNFKNSVIFSRATAAAVTLLCRNAFARTRFIVESTELLQQFDSDIARNYKACVNYIDTDGCIVSLHRIDRRASKERLRLLNGSVTVNVTSPDCIVSPSTWRENRVKTSDFLRINTERKNMFVELVNAMLNMEHVKLAAEEHSTIAASIFGRKKYTLFKLIDAPKARNVNDCFYMKKTGFEKNAARPVKMLYDRLLRNVMTINHVLSVISYDRFIAKIVDHRSVLYAMFDTLYEMWLDAIKNTDKMSNENDPDDRTRNELKVKDFSTKIPLNVRDTKGKIAEFIERTLREHQYDPGDRVNVIRLVPVDKESILKRKYLSDVTGRRIVVYDINDSKIVLLDEAMEHLDKYVPDLRAFLGGHLTYMYECIEGWKTMRGDRNDLLNVPVQIEPIAWRDDETFDIMCDHAKRYSEFIAIRRDVENINDSNRNLDDIQAYTDNGKIIYLRSLQTISSLFYSTWLWDRILSKHHVKTFPNGINSH